MLTRIRGQQLQHVRADAPALVVICNGKSDLGDRAILLGPVIAGNGNHSPLIERNECHPTVVVDVREVLDFLRRQAGLHPEEAEVPALGPQTFEEVDEQFAVLRFDGTDMDGVPGSDHNVELVFRWEVGHRSSQRSAATDPTCWSNLIGAPLDAVGGVLGSSGMTLRQWVSGKARLFIGVREI